MSSSGRGRRTGLLVAALASIAIHAVLLLLLVRAPWPALTPRREEIPVELVPAPIAPPPVAPPPAAQPPSTSGRGEPAPAQPGRGHPPREAKPPSGGSAPSGAAPGPATSPGELDAWFDAHGLGAEGRRERERERLSVAPPKELLDEAEREGELARNPSARAKARVDDLIAELKARDLARYPDASWMELRDGLAAGFAPGPEALRGRPGARGGLGDAIADAATAYQDTARRFAERGSPFGDASSEPGEVAPDKAAVAGVSAVGNRDRESLQAGVDRLAASAPPGAGGQPWTSGLVAVVELEQDEAGAVTRARLVRGSGSAAYDRLAVAQARRLIGRSLAPRLAGARTQWAFVTELLVAPPAAPALGLSFDADFKPAGASYPFARARRTRIELLSVRKIPERG